MSRHTKTLARRLSLLLEDLVLVSTSDQGRLGLELQDLSLSTQLKRAASLFPDLAVAVAGDTEVRVRADSLRLQQLLANLIRRVQRGGAQTVRLHVTCQGDTVMVALTGAPAEPGHELDIIRRLVLAHGGRLGLDREDGALLVTPPRARRPRR